MNLKRLFSGLLLLIYFPAWSQQDVVRLQCDGKYNNYALKAHEVEIIGDIVEVRKNTIKLIGFLDFDGLYSITETSDAIFGFSIQANPPQSGSINRYSGRIGVAIKEPIDNNIFTATFRGTCTIAKKLF